ncbi:MAG: hypothetical protein IKF77_07925 [Thermoguttaceae bacterium]|nr:hypothetical protein [Thermoguttaceae bacterium]MBR3219835.1 hypothetical protein [Thermoguttaceae bacterium]
MTYQLTPLLTSVAGCSATIIAIIGGFMVRKFIAMSSERHELTARVSVMGEELQQKRLQKEALSRADAKAAAALEEDIRAAEFKLRLLTARLEANKNPRGMKRGLLVFVVYSIFGVLFPLSLVPFETESCALFVVVKIVVLALMALCLAAVYAYFLYLLRWNNREVFLRWREYFQSPSGGRTIKRLRGGEDDGGHIGLNEPSSKVK